MAIRRFRDHVADQNWFAVLIDVAIVVVGVFLGLQANNWNQARLERAAAADYRREILADLQVNEIDLTARRAYSNAVRGHAVAALSALESAGGPKGEAFLIDAYQASQVWARPVVRTAYDEMVGAGLSRSMGDQQTRSRLTAYYTQIKQFDVTATGATPYRDKLRRALPYPIQSAINRKCGDRVTTLLNGTQTSALPERCSLGLDDVQVKSAIERLKAANLEDDLIRQIADLDQKIAGYSRFLGLAKSLRARLQAVDAG